MNARKDTCGMTAAGSGDAPRLGNRLRCLSFKGLHAPVEFNPLFQHGNNAFASLRGVGQLSHLLDMARRPNIVIQVIPVAAGAHEGLRGPFMIADFEDAPSVAWQDAAVFGQLVEDANAIASLMAMWDTLKSEASPRSASLALIEEAVKTWT
jgi:hypothetical protein